MTARQRQTVLKIRNFMGVKQEVQTISKDVSIIKLFQHPKFATHRYVNYKKI